MEIDDIDNGTAQVDRVGKDAELVAPWTRHRKRRELNVRVRGLQGGTCDELAFGFTNLFPAGAMHVLDGQFVTPVRIDELHVHGHLARSWKLRCEDLVEDTDEVLLSRAGVGYCDITHESGHKNGNRIPLFFVGSYQESSGSSRRGRPDSLNFQSTKTQWEREHALTERRGQVASGGAVRTGRVLF